MLKIVKKRTNMKIAVEGCCHGELDKIYETLQLLEKKESIKIDLLLCCGDFQAVRNETDLQCMAVPPKYRQMQTFYKYYSGEKKAPVPTVFIGGNHEASNHLWELPYGGWVAPNIYYLGYSGVVTFGGYRIAGLSGIYKKHDYLKGHFECPPYDGSSIRSAYHIRNIDVFKLKLLSQPLDIMLSHDWPHGIYHHGNVQKLYRYKSFLKKEIESNTLGSPPAAELLEVLQPEYWFSAHLHVKFPALVPHGVNDNGENKVTKFLALDKCLPKRDFLQVLDLGSAKGPMELHYDAEWLSITRLTNELINVSQNFTNLPLSSDETEIYKPNSDQVQEMLRMLSNELKIPENFVKTVSSYDPSQPKKCTIPKKHVNSQTIQFCKMLGGMNNPFALEAVSKKITASNPDEIDLGDDVNDDESGNGAIKSPLGNSDEIDINDEEDDVDQMDHADIKAYKRRPASDDMNNSDNVSHETGISNLAQATDSLQGTTEIVDLEPPKKTFKLVRRNQTLYESHNGEDDSG